MNFLKLIRIKNLLIIVVTQYIMRYFVIQPLLLQYNMELQLGHLDFLLLTFSTCLLAGAGYIINDYFDRKADLINRPNTVIVGIKIRRRIALIWHSVFNFFGVLIGFYLANKIHAWYFGFFYLGISGILWYYSTFYKKRVFIGNFVVALLTGLVALLVLFFELPTLQVVYGNLSYYPEVSYNLLIWVSGFSFFAFITTLIREIVKDMEDVEGDIENNRKSLPISFGFLKTKIAIWVFTGITILLLLFAYFYYLNNLWYYSQNVLLLLYILLLIIAPLVFFSFKLVFSNHKKQYNFLSSFMKIIMLAGLFFAIFSSLLMKQ